MSKVLDMSYKVQKVRNGRWVDVPLEYDIDLSPIYITTRKAVATRALKKVRVKARLLKIVTRVIDRVVP